MKIYILPVREEFRPPHINVTYPAHNGGFKDAEERYWEYLKENSDLVTSDPKEADWHYLPIFWTHWLVNHKFGTVDLHLLQDECNRVILDDSITFTIHEYAEQPKVNIGRTVAFLGSRTAPTGIDIPLLCAPHPISSRSKIYLANFVGSLKTHPMRERMKVLLERRRGFHIVGGGGTDYFVQRMLESYVALCPRGYGGASYRFYEAMQLGVVPFLIGDIDHRPFKKFIDWNSCSIYSQVPETIHQTLSQYKEEQLLDMGRKALEVYENEFAHSNWCKYIVKELESM